MVRPERVAVSRTAEADETTNVLRGRVDTLTFRGARTAVLLDVSGLRLEAEVANVGGEPPEWLEEGAEVSVLVSPRALRVLGTDAPATTGQVSVTTPEDEPDERARSPFGSRLRSPGSTSRSTRPVRTRSAPDPPDRSGCRDPHPARARTFQATAGCSKGASGRSCRQRSFSARTWSASSVAT